jgi:hypothetical protein
MSNRRPRLRAERKHNPVAKALALPLLRPRVERDRKSAAKRGYSKHRQNTEE